MKIGNAILYLLTALLICLGNTSKADSISLGHAFSQTGETVIDDVSSDQVLTVDNNNIPRTQEEMKRKVRVRIRIRENRFVINTPFIDAQPILFFENSGQSLYQSYRICVILFRSDLRGPPAMHSLV